MEYMTVKEFADEVKMCTLTILNSIKNGKIYAVRFGSGKRSPYRIPKTELERLQIARFHEKRT